MKNMDRFLKHSLYRILELSVRHQGTNKNAYVYWLEDPIILQWMKIIFAPVMRVSGLCTHVQPWTKPLPTPTLRIEFWISAIDAAWTDVELEDVSS